MKVIVEVGAASAMLGEACHARMALAILAKCVRGNTQSHQRGKMSAPRLMV